MHPEFLPAEPKAVLQMSEKIHVAIAFDESYAEQTTVMLYSLLVNNQLHEFTIHAFYNDLSEKTKKRISSNFSKFSNFTLNWIRFDKNLISGFEIRKGHVNEYSYTRIYIPEILKQIDRILYLDCDMIVLRDVSGLWRTELHGKTLAVAEDLSVFVRHADLQMPSNGKYFNAGLLVIDAKKWRKEKYTTKVTERLLELGGKAASWDQDGLNSVLHNDWIALAQEWNIQSHDIYMAQEKGVRDVKAFLHPAIVHFTGNLKPWNYKSSNPFKSDYYAYLNATDFKQTHRPENKTVMNVIRRIVRNIFVKLGLLKY